MLMNELPQTVGCQEGQCSQQISQDLSILMRKEFGQSPNFLETSVLTLESWVAFGTYESPEVESKCISVGVF